MTRSGFGATVVVVTKSSDNGRGPARNNGMNPPRDFVVAGIRTRRRRTPLRGPASVAVVDQDGEADSLGISLAAGAAESTGAMVSAPGELALPDGEHAASAAPRVTNRRSRLIMGTSWERSGAAETRASPVGHRSASLTVRCGTHRGRQCPPRSPCRRLAFRVMRTRSGGVVPARATTVALSCGRDALRSADCPRRMVATSTMPSTTDA